ncbi:MAG: mannosyltransferase family protein [Actinomycetota bacterium]
MDPTTADPAAAPARLAERAEGWRRLARPLALYLASRLVALLALGLAATQTDRINLLGALASWDGSSYVAIAQHGYPARVPELAGHATFSSIAFFPLLPLLIRALALATGLRHLVAALIVSNLAGVIAALLLWRLVERIGDRDWADRSVALFGVFPGALVLSMVYAEPLLLALALGCLLALLGRRWYAAGILAALGTAARPNGLALVAACAAAAAPAVLRDRNWRALAAPALAPLGGLAYLAYLWRHTGEPGAWFRVEREGWGQFFDFGAGTLRRAVHVLGGTRAYDDLLSTLGLVIVLMLAGLMVRWRPPAAVWAYTGLVVLLAVGSSDLGPQPRFVLTAFPLLIAAARWVRGTAFAVLLGACGAGMVAYAVISIGALQVFP